MDLKEIGINTRNWNWVDLAQNRDYWRAFVIAGSIFHEFSLYPCVLDFRDLDYISLSLSSNQ